jgi:hypothetical protein
MSLLGILQRYESQKIANKYGRWVSFESHAEAYKNLPANIQKIESESHIDRLSLYNRDNEAIYINDIEPTVRKLEAQARLIKERNRPLTKLERQYVHATEREIIEKMRNRNALPTEIRSVQKILHTSTSSALSLTRPSENAHGR